MDNDIMDVEGGGVYKEMLENMDIGVYFVDKSCEVPRKT